MAKRLHRNTLNRLGQFPSCGFSGTLQKMSLIPFKPDFEITQEELADFETHHLAMRALIAEVQNRRESIRARLEAGAAVEPGDLWFHRRLQIVLRHSDCDGRAQKTG